jgi:mono/diheme cytochrome c family protein
MGPVMRNLASVPEADVQAIAVYIASRAGQSKVGPAVAVKREQVGDPPGGNDEGAVLFEGACAGCHNSGTRGVRLENSTTVTDVVPTNMVRVIVDGVSPAEGEPSRSMPGFRGALNAAQTAAVARYVRSRYSRAAPWTDLEVEVTKVRSERPPGSAS